MEKDIEAYVRKALKREKLGRLLKWVSPGETGVPDRIAVLTYTEQYIPIEFKQPGGRLSPRQKMWQRILPGAMVIGSMEEARRWLNEVRAASLSAKND